MAALAGVTPTPKTSDHAARASAARSELRRHTAAAHRAITGTDWLKSARPSSLGQLRNYVAI